MITSSSVHTDIFYKAEPTYGKKMTAIGLDSEWYIHILDLTVSMRVLYDGVQRLSPVKF